MPFVNEENLYDPHKPIAKLCAKQSTDAIAPVRVKPSYAVLDPIVSISAIGTSDFAMKPLNNKASEIAMRAVDDEGKSSRKNECAVRAEKDEEGKVKTRKQKLKQLREKLVHCKKSTGERATARQLETILGLLDDIETTASTTSSSSSAVSSENPEMSDVIQCTYSWMKSNFETVIKPESLHELKRRMSHDQGISETAAYNRIYRFREDLLTYNIPLEEKIKFGFLLSLHFPEFYRKMIMGSGPALFDMDHRLIKYGHHDGTILYEGCHRRAMQNEKEKEEENNFTCLIPLTSIVVAHGGVICSGFPDKSMFNIGSHPYLHAHLGPIFIIHDGKSDVELYRNDPDKMYTMFTEEEFVAFLLKRGINVDVRPEPIPPTTEPDD